MILFDFLIGHKKIRIFKKNCMPKSFLVRKIELLLFYCFSTDDVITGKRKIAVSSKQDKLLSSIFFQFCIFILVLYNIQKLLKILTVSEDTAIFRFSVMTSSVEKQQNRRSYIFRTIKDFTILFFLKMLIFL